MTKSRRNDEFIDDINATETAQQNHIITNDIIAEPPLRISKPKQTIEERRMLDKIRKRNKRESERQKKLNPSTINQIQNKQK